MKRLIIGIFISTFAILLMSHNVFATTINVAPGYARIHRVARTDFTQSSYEDYPFNVKNNTLGFAVAVIGQTWSIRSMSLPMGTTIEANSYYTMSLTLVNAYVGTLAGLGCNKIDNVSYVQGTTEDTTIYVMGHVTCDVTNLEFGDNNNPNMVFLHGTATTEGIWIFQPKINFFEYQDQSAETLNETKQEVQDASDASETAGSSSSSDAASGTSSLLSVIGAGIGAITTAQPTNCRINGDMGNLDVGTIDLCGNPVPTFISVIGSIIAVLVVLPLVIILFNRFISIIRSFQG